MRKSKCIDEDAEVRDPNEPEIKDNLDPVLLFTVLQKKTKVERGVFYVPQQGVGIIGLPFDGSSCSVARHIVNQPGISLIPGVISPELNQNSILKAISEYLRGGVVVPDPTNDDEEEDN